jgi:hypothetical protein
VCQFQLLFNYGGPRSCCGALITSIPLANTWHAFSLFCLFSYTQVVAVKSSAIPFNLAEESTVRGLISAVLLCLPFSAIAANGHLDVIKFELVDGCSLADHQAITRDFNEWGKDYGYQARVAAPLQNDDLSSYYWLGESADAATYGGAWDAWRDALADSDSVPAGLAERFAECSKNISRAGYDLY